MRLIDTHCHLNDRKAFPDPSATLIQARAAGVDRIIVIGVDEESSITAVEMARKNESVFAVVGWHPNYSANYKPQSLKTIGDLAADPKVVAIGEIGLDFHWDYATREQQEASFFDHMDLAEEIGKPVVFHCREAYPALLDLLEGRSTKPDGMLFHCFAGDEEDAARARALDCYFGVDGPITYKKAEGLREIMRTMPRERVVLETDSPYLTPAPHRGKPNTPAFVPLINQALADVWEVDAETCAKLTTKNAERFFRLAAGSDAVG